jgi:hypothetical protein
VQCRFQGIPHAMIKSNGGPNEDVSVPHACSSTLTAFAPWLTPAPISAAAEWWCTSQLLGPVSHVNGC